MLTARSGNTGGLTWEATASTGISNLVEDTTPQLGGDLDLNGNGITSSNQVSIAETSGNGVFIRSSNQGVIHAYGGSNGGVYLRHNNDTKFKVEGGNVTTDGGADFTFEGASYNAVWDASDNALEFADNAKAKFGTGGDLEIYHDINNSKIKHNGNGKLQLLSDQIQFWDAAGGEQQLTTAKDGAVNLYYDNAVKLATSSSGVTVTGTLAATAVTGDGSGLTNVSASDSTKMPLAGGTFTGDVTFEGGTSGRNIVFDRSDNALEFNNDYVKAKFGSGSQMELYYSSSEGANVRAIVGSTGYPLSLWGSDVRIKDPNGNTIFRSDGTSAELYEDGAKKLETTSSGVTVTGNIVVSGTVDGRDLAADGSKLDGIASSANNYVHPNHSGEVTSSADGATVIADNVVDEANLKVSNSPTNGYVLTAQSGNTGGLTWAEAASGADLYAADTTSSTNPTASGNRSVAIGSGATASATEAVAIGKGATASGTESMALHRNSLASGLWSTALGQGAYATATNSIALGTSAYAYGAGGAALGRNSKSYGEYAISLGQSYASGADSFAAAIANNSTSYGATGANSIAIGQQAKATGTASVKIGRMGTIAGDYSVGIGNGGDCTSNATFSVALQGTYLNASASLGFGSESEVQSGHDRSIILGRGAKSRTKGGVHFGGYNAISAGQNQAGIYILASNTTDATAEALTTNNSTASTDNQIILPNESAMTFTGTVVVREDASDGDDYAGWEIKGVIMRQGQASDTALGVGIVNDLYHTAGLANAAVALSADTTNGGLKIQVTGIASTNLNWVATVHTSEVVNA